MRTNLEVGEPPQVRLRLAHKVLRSSRASQAAAAAAHPPPPFSSELTKKICPPRVCAGGD